MKNDPPYVHLTIQGRKNFFKKSWMRRINEK